MKMSPPSTLKQFCEKCGKELDKDEIVWLEKSCATNLYSEPTVTGYLSENESQGMFPFGKACAKKVLDIGWTG